MAARAVGVKRAKAVVSIVGGRDELAAGPMLVLMVAEVLVGRAIGFVRAVRRCRAPDQLERHDEQQEYEQPTTHDSDSRPPYTGAPTSRTGQHFPVPMRPVVPRSPALECPLVQCVGWRQAGVGIRSSSDWLRLRRRRGAGALRPARAPASGCRARSRSVLLSAACAGATRPVRTSRRPSWPRCPARARQRPGRWTHSECSCSCRTRNSRRCAVHRRTSRSWSAQ